MKLYDEKTYFLNKNNEIVEVERYDSGINPFGDPLDISYAGLAWGENFKEAKDTMHDKVGREVFSPILNKIAESMESKYDIQVDLDDTHEWAVEAYNKETGELEYADVYNMDKDDVIYEIMRQELTDSNGFFQLGEMLEYCENNNVDVSDVIMYEAISSHVDRDSCAYVFITEENIQDYFGIDISEIPTEDKAALLKNYIELGQAYLDGEEYAFTTYSLKGEEIDDCVGFFGDDTKTNGIEDTAGEFTECLGAYDSIEECFEANQEKLGIVIDPLPSLSERISFAEEKAASQEVSDNKETSKDELAM